MGDIVSISPEPSLLSAEEREAIRVRSMAAGRKIADVLVAGMNAITDAKTADQVSEIQALKARVERLERLLALREVGASIGE